jgi:hypothetical protein
LAAVPHPSGSRRGVIRMSTRAAAWLAWSMWALYVMLLILTRWLDLLTPPIPMREEGGTAFLDVLFAVLTLTYPTVGALVASRRPENPIGWIFLGAGLVSLAFQSFALRYADYADYASLPGKEYMAWLSDWIGIPGAALATVLLLLLFPSSRLSSRGSRVAMWMAICGTAIFSLSDASMAGPLDTHPSIDNPAGVEGNVGNALELGSRVGMFLLGVSGIFAVLSLINRLVRARGQERQQLKWFAFASAVMIGGFFGIPLFSSSNLLNEASWGIGMFGFMFFPVATGIAILKYRLYDIDLLINRTLVYGSLTATLILLYFGGIVVLQRLFVVLTGQESTLAIVASTLAIAALFNPLRRRVQALVDRRLYRRKYDARKTLEAFSNKLRDETDLEALNDELVGVVREAMQPAHVSLWLRSPTQVGGGQELS